MSEYYIKRSPGDTLEVGKRVIRRDVWVHSRGTSRELDELTHEFLLNKNILLDVRDEHELPRIEHDHDAVYVFLRTPENGSATTAVKTYPVVAVLLPHAFITVAPKSSFSPQAVADLPFSTDHPGQVFLITLADVVSRFEERIRAANEQIASLRHSLQTHEVNNTDFVRFVTIEDNLSEYHIHLEHTLRVTQRLHESAFMVFSSVDKEMLEDTLLHIQQLLVSVSANRQTLASIQNAYSTIANNTLNSRMKTLTGITILMAIPNIIFGMYGMNVALPVQENPFAFGAVLAATTLLILLVVVLVKRAKLF
ncbi:magnesium transporter CorA family protein [Candidatus Saccharibacteria bacterium]|nr:magnesium transporter CorA family protein [Candidatus Saccharibacteria bacterium]